VTLDGTSTYTLSKESYAERNPFTGECDFKMMSLQFPPGQPKIWVLGLNFFHMYYTIFDAEKMRVGFVEAKGAIRANIDRVQKLP
jgi:hypothetical protein